MEQLHLVYPLHDIAHTVADGKAGSSISISLSSIIIYDIIYFIVVIARYLLLLFNCSRYLCFKTNPLHQNCLVHWSYQGMIGERQVLLFPSDLL